MHARRSPRIIKLRVEVRDARAQARAVRGAAGACAQRSVSVVCAMGLDSGAGRRRGREHRPVQLRRQDTGHCLCKATADGAATCSTVTIRLCKALFI